MLAAALEAEVDDYLAAHAAERDEQGRRLVVRNGHARRREVLTAAGAVAARAPRVNDRRTDPVTGGRVGFRSVVRRFVSLTLLDDLHCDRPNNVVPEQLACRRFARKSIDEARSGEFKLTTVPSGKIPALRASTCGHRRWASMWCSSGSARC
jgi:hypothetical protein